MTKKNTLIFMVLSVFVLFFSGCPTIPPPMPHYDIESEERIQEFDNGWKVKTTQNYDRNSGESATSSRAKCYDPVVKKWYDCTLNRQTRKIEWDEEVLEKRKQDHQKLKVKIPVNEGGGCFDPDTLVLMADGSSKRIIDIKVGDMVMAYDEKKQKKVAAEVLATKNGVGDHHYVINDEIRVTPPHPFYTADNRWVKIADLKAGQDVRISSSFSKIKTLKKYDNGFKIYNISVKDHQNFYVSGKGQEFFLVQQGN